MGRSSHLSFARAVPIALLLALTAPAVAHADASLSVTGSAPHKTLTFTVNDALDHSVLATVATDDLVIVDSVGVGSGCAPFANGSVICGPAADFERLVFRFGAGDDDLDAGALAIPLTVDGGRGNDVLAGGALGDDVACGPGDDVVYAYDDADTIYDDCETVDPPYLEGELVITGDPRVGSVLSLSLPTNLGGDGEVFIDWERCDASGYDCRTIAGANGQTHTPTAADLGHRLRAAYTVENALGDDWVESAPTRIVLAARQPPAPPPPIFRPSVPRPPSPPIATPRPSVFAALAKPKLAIRAGRPVVDTGRAIGCPDLGTVSPCHVTATALAHGKSAGRATNVQVAEGTRTRLAVPLNARAYRQLRAHRKLTISVTWRISRPVYGKVGATFTITVKLPPRKRR
jgi:hypothetical protein